MTSLKLLSFLCILVLLSCEHQNTAPLFQKDLTNEIERNNTLFVFVGEKIDVKEIPNRQGYFDAGVNAKYKILQRIYGDYSMSTIDFEAYDHFREFPFAKYKNVLMFVSKDKETGKYYQEKYQYADVYKTKNGRWAGSCSEDYSHPYNEHTRIKPEKIDFVQEVSYPTKTRDQDGKYYTINYLAPYYKTVGDKAIAVYGNYVEDLFRLKKGGVLTARQLFGNTAP